MAKKLLALLTISIHNASWLVYFFVGALSVLLILLVIAALAAIFGKAEIREYAYKVFQDLLGLFRDLLGLVRGRKRARQEQP